MKTPYQDKGKGPPAVRDETILIIAQVIFMLILAVVTLVIASCRPLQLLLVPVMAFWMLWDYLFPSKGRR